MNDAFDLPKTVDDTPISQTPIGKIPEIVLPPAGSHRSVTEAIQQLNQIKAYALTYLGKDNMNPHLWLQRKGVDELLRRLTHNPTAEVVDAALSLTQQEPNINLFSSEYEPAQPAPRRT